jgi:hypothetical protein
MVAVFLYNACEENLWIGPLFYHRDILLDMQTAYYKLITMFNDVGDSIIIILLIIKLLLLLLSYHTFRSRNSSVDIATDYGAQPTEYPMGSGDYFTGGKAAGRESHFHLVPKSRMVKLHLHFRMSSRRATQLIKHKDPILLASKLKHRPMLTF